MRFRSSVTLTTIFVAALLTVAMAFARPNKGLAKASTKSAAVDQPRARAPQAIHSAKSSRVFRGVVHRPAQPIDMARKIAVVDGKEVPIIVDEDQMPVEQGYVDENGDGFLDLVRKEADGVSWLYLNQGTASNPLYRSGRPLTEAEMASLSRYIVYTSPDDSITKAVTIQPTAWVFLSYARFDVYIDSAYYAHNTPQIDQLWDRFEPRYALLEATTGWSTEKYSPSGTKFGINVTSTLACWGGSAWLGYANVRFSDPLYNPLCARSYYDNGTLHFGNPGELGDWWGYIETAIHEALHAMNHPAIIARSWLTEGFSRYYEYNILSNYNGNGFTDINQESADTFIYQGTVLNWADYVANDYKDYYNNPIQSSMGYAITAWMFSMMRDNHSLNWSLFYNLMENNRETVDKAYALAAAAGNGLVIDPFVIDLFGRASGLTFPQTQAIWRYDGPSGPGWGVRNWTDLNWYADLSPSIEIECSGDSILLEATVHNSGDVSLHTVRLGIYVGENAQWEDTIAVSAHDSTIVTVMLPSAAFPAQVSAKVNTDSTKLESDYNDNTAAVYVSDTYVRDTDADSVIDCGDNCPTVANPGQLDTDADGIGDACDNCPTTWNPEQEDLDSNGVGNVCQPGFTPTGVNVSVNLSHGVKATFASVTRAGSTTATASYSGPPPPIGWIVYPGVLPVYYEIQTTASYTPPITVCFTYSDASLSGPEAELRLFHYEGGSWGFLALTLQDLFNNIICANVSSLSPFIMAQPGCSCLHQGDLAPRPSGDGVIDVFDVIEVIGVAFSGSPDIQDPQCPETRGDVDNNGVADVFDVIYIIATAFSGGANPVDPCGP